MLKTLAKSLRGYRKTSIVTMAMAILEVAFEIIIPLHSGHSLHPSSIWLQ